LNPQPTRPAHFQFLRRSQRLNTSSLREQKQSKQRANNPCIFNCLHIHDSISSLDSYFYKLRGGGYFFPASQTLSVLCVSALPFLFSPFDSQRPKVFPGFNCRLSAVSFKLASRWTRHSIAGTLLLTRRVSPRAIPPPQSAGRTHSAVPKFSVSLTNQKTKASKSCSRD
jgi:hypothetical protein